MNNVLLAGALIASAVLGGIAGGSIQANRDAADIEAAWDDVVVVRDGTLIPNPSAYAYDPDQLASSNKLVVISKSRAAAQAAFAEAL